MSEEIKKEVEAMEEAEFEVFDVETSDGQTVTMAIVDEFDFEEKHYIVAALVVEDTVNEDEIYIYREDEEEGEFVPGKIETAEEYERIANAYLAMDEE